MIRSAFALLLIMAAPIAAQQVAPPSIEQGPEIVVEGGRWMKGPEGTQDVPASGPVVREFDERAIRFAKCAKKVDLRWLRQIVDGEPYSSEYAYGLDRAIRTNIGCYSAVEMLNKPEPFLGECNPIVVVNGLIQCRAPLDRGALLAEAINRYVPDIDLNRDQTADPAVQARLKAVEVPRNRLRPESERQFVQLALCMVAYNPDIAIRMVRETGHRGEQAALGMRMITQSVACLGGAKKVSVEPAAFRYAIIDATYRWVVAARGVASLLPPEAKG